jgi:hypothetical protein
VCVTFSHARVCARDGSQKDEKVQNVWEKEEQQEQEEWRGW